MLQISNIYKSFGKQHVLKGVSFELEKGKVYTLVGGNGSGKTTLFNIITGCLKAEIGTIQYKNILLNNKTTVEINKLGIARTFQDLRMIKNISVKENLLLALKRNCKGSILNEFKYFNKNDYEKVEEIIAKVSLTKEKDSLAHKLSYGQQKLLTIGCCLANDSEVLLLDEPIAGIDKSNYQKIMSLINSICYNHCILQIEHNLKFIKETSNKVIFLNGGKNFIFENYTQFIQSEFVNKNYLIN